MQTVQINKKSRDFINNQMALNGFKYGFTENDDYYYSGSIDKDYINFHNQKAYDFYLTLKQ